MEPYREPSDVNRTEVECAKLRESSETKRKAFEEREKTKRALAAEREQTKRHRGDGWLVPWFLSVVMIITAVVGAAISYSNYLDVKAPSRACRETAEVISSPSAERRCSAGGSLEVTPAMNGPGYWLVRCRCAVNAPVLAASGAAPEASAP